MTITTRERLKLLALFTLGGLAGLLLFTAVAGAATAPAQPHSFVFPSDQLWAVIAGGLAPLAAYVLNHFAPWVSEPIKGVVQAVAAAIAGGVAQAITAGNIGFNDTTLQFVVTAVMAALFAHVGYKSAGINVRLGAGSDAPAAPKPAA